MLGGQLSLHQFWLLFGTQFHCVVLLALSNLTVDGILQAGGFPNAMLTITPLQHILIGSFLFGTVFMATEPVTSSHTNTGRWIYGFLIGVLTVIIRSINPAYPEGVFLAILIMNMFAPLIDYYVVQANIKMRLARNV